MCSNVQECTRRPMSAGEQRVIVKTKEEALSVSVNSDVFWFKIQLWNIIRHGGSLAMGFCY